MMSRGQNPTTLKLSREAGTCNDQRQPQTKAPAAVNLVCKNESHLVSFSWDVEALIMINWRWLWLPCTIKFISGNHTKVNYIDSESYYLSFSHKSTVYPTTLERYEMWENATLKKIVVILPTSLCYYYLTLKLVSQLGSCLRGRWD